MEMNRTGYAAYLEHHGVKGHRWGIIRTPEQLGHRTSSKRKTAKKRKVLNLLKRRAKSSGTAESSEKKAAQKQAKISEKARKKAEKKALKDVARREKILKSPTLLYKHRNEFSPDEIKKAMGNIKMEQELQQLSMNQLSKGQAYLETAVKYANSGIKAYNNVAKVYNAFAGENRKELPVIGGKKDKDKDKDKKKKDDN